MNHPISPCEVGTFGRGDRVVLGGFYPSVVPHEVHFLTSSFIPLRTKGSQHSGKQITNSTAKRIQPPVDIFS